MSFARMHYFDPASERRLDGLGAAVPAATRGRRAGAVARRRLIGRPLKAPAILAVKHNG
jgi:hypothetical protein